MISSLKSLKPRPELVAGSFNPEIFTASLRRVLGDYYGYCSNLAASNIGGSSL